MLFQCYVMANQFTNSVENPLPQAEYVTMQITFIKKKFPLLTDTLKLYLNNGIGN